jgi:hypothetical protein
MNQEINTTSKTDIENATKAYHSAQFLVSELRALMKTENLLLSEIALRDLENAADIEIRLKRVLSILESS